MSERKLVTNYDEKADVLYINFYDPPLEADYGESNRNCIFRYRDLEVIGVTVLDWKTFQSSASTTKTEVEE